MTKAVSTARAVKFEYRRAAVRGGLILACIGALAACGDDEGPIVLPGVNPGPNPAGACNFASQGTCDEYAEVDAKPGTADGCTSAGGAWNSGLCPVKARNGVCIDRSPASRTYSYTEAAAEGLKSSCAAEKFVVIKETPGRGMMYPTAGKGGMGSAAGGKGGSGAGAGGASGGAGGASGGAGGASGGAGGAAGGAGGAGAGNGGRGGAGGAAGED